MPGVGREKGMNRWSTKDLRAVKNYTLYYIGRYMSLYCIPIHRMYIPRVNPNINYGFEWLWCVNIRSPIVTNVPCWWKMLVMRESCICGVRVYIGHFYAFISIFLWTSNFSKKSRQKRKKKCTEKQKKQREDK